MVDSLEPLPCSLTSADGKELLSHITDFAAFRRRHFTLLQLEKGDWVLHFRAPDSKDGKRGKLQPVAATALPKVYKDVTSAEGWKKMKESKVCPLDEKGVPLYDSRIFLKKKKSEGAKEPTEENPSCEMEQTPDLETNATSMPGGDEDAIEIQKACLALKEDPSGGHMDGLAYLADNMCEVHLLTPDERLSILKASPRYRLLRPEFEYTEEKRAEVVRRMEEVAQKTREEVARKKREEIDAALAKEREEEALRKDKELLAEKLAAAEKDGKRKKDEDASNDREEKLKIQRTRAPPIATVEMTDLDTYDQSVPSSPTPLEELKIYPVDRARPRIEGCLWSFLHNVRVEESKKKPSILDNDISIDDGTLAYCLNRFYQPIPPEGKSFTIVNSKPLRTSKCTIIMAIPSDEDVEIFKYTTFADTTVLVSDNTVVTSTTDVSRIMMANNQFSLKMFDRINFNPVPISSAKQEIENLEEFKTRSEKFKESVIWLFDKLFPIAPAVRSNGKKY